MIFVRSDVKSMRTKLVAEKKTTLKKTASGLNRDSDGLQSVTKACYCANGNTGLFARAEARGCC